MTLRIKLLIPVLTLAAGIIPAAGASGQSKNDDKFTVMIDPGHGGKAAGTTGTGRYRNTEKYIALNVALYLRKLIEDGAPDIRPLLTRTTDVDVSLNQRSVMANKAKADLFVSIHCNSLVNVKRDGPKIWGAETYVMSLNKLDVNKDIAKKENADILLEDNYKEVYKGFDPNDPASLISIDLQQTKHLVGSIEMAKLTQKHLGITAERKDKGVKQAVFWVICHNTMPSVLVEIGYLSNPTEEVFLHSEKGQRLVAKSLYDAIKEYKIRFYDPMNGDDGASPGSIENIITAQVALDTPEDDAQDTATATNSNVYYCVQLTASPTPLNIKTNVLLKKFTGVKYFREKNMYKYTTRHVPSYSQAQKDLEDARKKGAKDAFVVAFEGDKKTTVARARSLTSE